MSNLISRQTAIDALEESKEMINTILESLTLDYNARRNLEQRRGQINEDIETIKKLPSAEPKTGEWRMIGVKNMKESPIIALQYRTCTNCNKKIFYPYYDNEGIIGVDFCPNCGADMRGNKYDKR